MCNFVDHSCVAVLFIKFFFMFLEVPAAKPKKKSLAERIAEREEKKRLELERKKKEVSTSLNIPFYLCVRFF